jgi:putative two-component system response regulator
VSSDLSENGENMHHIARVGFLSRLIAQKIGLEQDFCNIIELAAPLHDIGMLEVPRSILSKPGQLSMMDWQEIRRHSKLGRQILSGADCPVLNMAADISLSHHERWDERGYPEGLGQGNIPTPAFITSVADSFDVMVSSRKYRKELLIQEAFAELRNNSGKQFSPICVYSLQSLRPVLMSLYTEVCEVLVQG